MSFNFTRNILKIVHDILLYIVFIILDDYSLYSEHINSECTYREVWMLMIYKLYKKDTIIKMSPCLPHQ